jgi:hypothetical protein
MNVLVLQLNSYSKNGFHFLDTKQNMIMDGVFTKLIYVDAHFTMNSVFLACFAKKNKLDKSLNSLLQLENELLSQYEHRKRCHDKKAVNKIEGHILSGKIKLQEYVDIIIKISGIWETENEYGLTYKFFPI